MGQDLIDKPVKASVHRVTRTTTPTANKTKPGFKSSGKSALKNEEITFDASDTTALQTGMQVEHPKFGLGKVIVVEGDGPNKKATVYFNAIGKKNLLLRFAKLKIIT